ncbi:MAG: exodeoxyribonuclease V subunit alpha [Lautropia sp.]
MNTPEQRQADAFAARIEAWSLAEGASTNDARAAANAARELGLAQANGHVCIALADLEITTRRETLIASRVVGTPGATGAMPLILDDGDRLYLHRYFDHERRLARRLMRALAQPVALDAATVERLRARLQALFASNAAASGGDPDWQRLAAALALRSRLAIISGGPGTGKTTTVVNLLACLIEHDADCRIALAAPTGKAAARMTEAIRQRAAHLPEALRTRLPGSASTVHRLLGFRPFDGGFSHGASNPLPIDALVVDEASMLDLALATRLLEAVPDAARIVMLGDKDQLAAVESGAVFAELGADPTLGEGCIGDLSRLAATEAHRIVAPPPRQASALRDAVVWLSRSFRFAGDSGIGRLASLVNAGDDAAAIARLRAGDDDGVRWIDDDAAPLPPAAIDRMREGFEVFAAAVDRDPQDREAIMLAFARYRVLCAVRDGARGVDAVNAEIARHLRERLARHARDGLSPWFPGRPVIVLRNDHVLRLFNGDVGIALPDPAGVPMVHFPDPAGGLRAIAPVRLPAHETAFAMTVHKAQGSEFDDVLVVLPAQRSRVLTRELLYTAVTRARSRVTLCAPGHVLATAIATSTRRRSGLLARLREHACDDPRRGAGANTTED